MTHVSEGIASPAHNLGSIWGSFWDTDKTQWQWHAPTPRSSNRDESAAALPSWLLEWDTTSQEQAAEPVDVEDIDWKPAQLVTVEDDIRQFREDINVTSGKRNIRKLSADFAAQLKQSFSLGLVSSETFGYILQHISTDIIESFPNEKYTDYLLLAFYNTIWEGITASKVFRPMDFDAEVMNRLVYRLAAMPVTKGVQTLAHRVLRSLSDVQLRAMEHGIVFLVQKWTEDWLVVREPKSCEDGIPSAESLVMEAVQKGLDAHRLTMASKQYPKYEPALIVAKEAISGAYAAVSKAIDATVEAEDIISPLRVSVKALAFALEKLPQDLLEGILTSCTKHVMDKSKIGSEASRWPFRYHWLSVVAQIPNAHSFWLRIWRTVDVSHSIRGKRACEIILQHWICEGKVEKAAAVTNTFEAYAEESDEKSASFARLLLALDQHRQMSFTRTADLFNLLRVLGRNRQIGDILLRMKELDMKIPTTILRKAVDDMSRYDPKKALDMFFLPWKMQRGYPLRPELMPEFILALIDDPKIRSFRIWNVLRIPIYDTRRQPRRRFQPHFAKPLSKEMINLIHKMAIAFAHSDARPSRVAFQNVIQCYDHLRIHRAPISPVLARAITHVAVAQSIVTGQIVGLSRLRYVLDVITRIEGEDVAKEVDETVYKWRQFVKGEKARLHSAANPLRLGLGQIG